MLMARIGPDRDWSEFLVIRLFRRWSAARESGCNPAASLIELAAELDQSAMIAIALDSLLQLTESCLGRQLESECCCSRSLSSDEAAILQLIGSAETPIHPFTAREIPHGLPSALQWAARSLRSLLGEQSALGPAGSVPRCPFSNEEERARRVLK